jgi:hypothetical protein
MKPLSQKFAELSVQAKSTEERVAKAQSETKARIDEQREHVRLETEQALGKVQQRVEQTRGEARTRFNALQAKVDSDFADVKAKAQETKGKLEAWQADNYASDKEADALAAIDYAVAATRMAELQTLDAIAARAESDLRAEQIQPTPTMA